MLKKYFNFFLFLLFSFFSYYLFILLYNFDAFMLHFYLSEILLSSLFILILIAITASFISIISIIPGKRILTKVFFFPIFIYIFWQISKIIKLWVYHTLNNIKFIHFIFTKFHITYWVLRLFLLSLSLILLFYFLKKFYKDPVKKFIDFFSPLPHLYFVLFITSILIFIPRFFLNKTQTEIYKKGNITGKNLPNIILIIFDALSADHMSLYGYKKKTTPFIDEFSKSAYVFEPLVTVSTYTPTSVISIYSSLYPKDHKVFAFYQYPSEDVIREKNIFKYFKEKGYKIYAIIQNPVALMESFRLEDYFAQYFFSFFKKYPLPFLLHLTSKISRRLNIYTFPYFFNFLSSVLQDKRTGLYILNYKKVTPFPLEPVFKEAIKIIKNEEKASFILLHLYCPHDPYLPPGIKKPKKFNNSIKQILYTDRSHTPSDSIDINLLKNLYDENIKYLDREFEKFIEELEKINKIDQTIFILTSDHGESFYYQWVGHNAPSFFSNELIKVPLIIKTPNSKFKYVKKLGSVIDIFPTLLDILGFPKPFWVKGISLFDNYKTHNFVYSGYYQLESKFSPKLKNSNLCVIKDSFKFYYNIKTEEYHLYNFKKDPFDRTDISESHPETVKELLEIIKKEIL